MSDAVVKQLAGKEFSPSGYVATPQEYLACVHNLVRTQLQGELSKRIHASALSGTTRKAQFAVGDRVLVRKPPLAVAKEAGHDGVSKRLLPLTSSTVYVVYKVVSPSRVVLCDVDTREAKLSFAQPIATERLVAYDLAGLEVPLELGSPLVLEVRKESTGEFRRATLAHQSATGLVRVVYDNGEEEWLDLACYEHRWVSAPAFPAP